MYGKCYPEGGCGRWEVVGTGLHNGSCTSVDTYAAFNYDNLCDDEGQQEYCANDGVTYGKYYPEGGMRQTVGSGAKIHISSYTSEDFNCGKQIENTVPQLGGHM